MNIVVCLKAVPTNVKMPAPRSDGSGILTEGNYFMNPSDEYVLEQALLLKRECGARVTAVTVGPVKSQDMLYVSLARGADAVMRVNADEFDPNIVSFILARTIRALSYDLILTGVESSDGMSSQVGISLGAQLGLPYVYAVTKIALGSGADTLLVTRELGGGRYQTLQVDKPVLLCVQSGIASFTYIPPAKLFYARGKGVPSRSLSDLGITGEELARRRKTKVIEIKRVEQNNLTQWLTGNPEQLAREIIDKIREAL